MTDSNSPDSGADSGLRRPRNLAAPGRKLWDAAVSSFEFAGHELAMLEEACRTRDVIALLDARVSEDGLMLASSQGQRVHPALTESRHQRLTLARLLATLGIPPLEEDVLPRARAVRGVRGVYGGS